MEGAQIVTMSLPHGQAYAWFPELNIVALSSGLDKDGRERALDELQQEWRRTLRVAG